MNDDVQASFGPVADRYARSLFHADPARLDEVVELAQPRGGEVALDVATGTGNTALALAPHRIRVNAIAPGLTDTAQPRYGNTEEQIAERAREIPLGRIAQPEEIARIAVFLASEESGWITGELIHVNGGAYMA